MRFVWYLVAFIPVGFPVLKEAVECLREKEYFNEFMLMSLAAIGAFYIGEYPEGVAVMLFYSIGEKFQDSAVSRARSNIRALLDVRPEQATVIRDGQEKIEKPEQVRVGEIIEIKVGERVPLDGIMLGDVAAFNTAALTGESVPRNIRTGEDVLAGMIASLIAQGMEPFQAAMCGVHLHGLAGDRAAARLSQHAMQPTDMLEELCALFSELEQ